MSTNMRLYSLKDIKADRFGPIFHSDTDATAVRSFQGSIQGKDQSLLSTYPEDFQLFFVGEFDPVSGEMWSRVALVVSGSSFSNSGGVHADLRTATAVSINN